jgi:uncharacterized membrane protein YedE/YeeE
VELLMAAPIVVVIAGALFGFGLALSGMIRPEVVLSFLQFRDWGLMLVMGGALVVALVAWQLFPMVRAAALVGGVAARGVGGSWGGYGADAGRVRFAARRPPGAECKHPGPPA